MLRYRGDDEYEVFTDSGKQLRLSKSDLLGIQRDMAEQDIIDCKPIDKVDEDYEMLASENKHLAQWIKDRTGLDDEKVTLIAQTGTFAKDS